MVLVGLRSKLKGLGLAVKSCRYLLSVICTQLPTCRNFIVHAKCQEDGEQEQVNIFTVIFLNWEIFGGHMCMTACICVDRNNRKDKLLLKIYVGTVGEKKNAFHLLFERGCKFLQVNKGFSSHADLS